MWPLGYDSASSPEQVAEFLDMLAEEALALQARDGDRVVALEKQWTEAYKQRDVGILSSVLADDFVITVEDGSTFGKLGYISHSADTSVKWNWPSYRI